MSRRPYIAGNWKMHKTVAEAEEFIAAFLPQIFGEDHAEVVLCAPYTALTPLVMRATMSTRLLVAARWASRSRWCACPSASRIPRICSPTSRRPWGKRSIGRG